MLKAITTDIKKLEQNINNGVYEKKYNEYIENENVKNKSFDKKSIDSPEDIKKLLILFRGTLNDYTVFYKTFISNATHAYTTSIKICKMLTKQLFVKNEN